MITFEVRPGVGVGPFELGMTLDAVLIAAEGAGAELSDSDDPAVVVLDNWMAVHLDASERVDWIDVVVPPWGDDERSLVLGDLVLGLPVDEVVAALDRIATRFPHRSGLALARYPELGLEFATAIGEDPITNPFEFLLVQPAWEEEPSVPGDAS